MQKSIFLNCDFPTVISRPFLTRWRRTKVFWKAEVNAAQICLRYTPCGCFSAAILIGNRQKSKFFEADFSAIFGANALNQGFLESPGTVLESYGLGLPKFALVVPKNLSKNAKKSKISKMAHFRKVISLPISMPEGTTKIIWDPEAISNKPMASVSRISPWLVPKLVQNFDKIENCEK